MKTRTLHGLLLRAFVYAAVAAALAVAGLAQITTTGIRGIVRDQSGAVIPNATIKLVDNSTGVEYATVSSSDGGFLFPNLQFGSYKLTATAAGFQTTVIATITVESGRTTDVSVELKVGAAAETVQVTALAEQLKTTTNEVGTTINNKLVQDMPYNNRDGLAFALLMAGNANANDASGRNSTFNGLPNASMNISLDGMNNNSQRFKSGGTSFFSFAPARIDAIEEVTVSTTGLGAEAGGEGAMQIRLVTKRGTDQYHGKVLHQFRNEALNANSFFNNLQGIQRTKSRENDAVGSIGGPLLPFIPYFKKKLFFFAYYEHIPQPGSQTSTAPVLTAASQQGDFTYVGTDGVTRTVNLLQVAGAAGFTRAIDPTIAGILKSINDTQSKASGFLPQSGTPYLQTMFWNQPTNTTTYFPTARVDYQITPAIGWHGTWNLRHQDIAGRPPYPGNPYPFAPNQTSYKITTYVATNSVDWTIRPNMVNNATFGVQSNGEFFTKEANPQQYSVYGNRILNIPLIPAYLPGSGQQPFIRNNPVYQVTDNLSWVKGRHTLTMGGTLLHTSFYETSYGSAGVPQYNFGVVAADQVGTVLQNALPGVNTNNGDLTNAQNLYALLTGRLTSITVNTNVNEGTKQYSQFAPVTQRFAFTTAGLYAQDSFRINPDFTLNFGLRWQFDGAIQSTNGIDSEPAGPNFFGPSNGLFQPGALSNVTGPVFVQVSNPDKRDFINPAPNLGFAWNPSKENGFLGRLFGERKTVIRGAFSITFYNEGMNSISNLLSGNQGTTQSGSATQGVQFAPGTLNLSSPAPPISLFPQSFSFPLQQSSYTFSASGYSGSLINPNLRSPYTQNWTLGIQRQLTRNIVLEARYVGNKSTHLWHSQNLQETNIFENGFLDQFIQAKKNLDINVANGKGNTFINNGLPGQAAIPIFQAAFGPLGSQGAVSNSQGFGNSTFITNLNQAVAGTLANTLATNTTYYCRLVGSNFAPCATLGFTAAGKYPLNLFRANPFLNNMNYQDSNGDTNYNALQIDLRQQYSYGLLLGANYTWSHALGDIRNESDQTATYQWFTTRDASLNYGPTPFDRRHVFNAYWTYDLPFGKGRRFSVNNGVVERLIGGWTLGGRETIASGNPALLNGGRNTVNNLTQAGVVFGGMTPDQLQRALSKVSGYFAGNKVLISDIASIATITATTSRVNPELYAPASTPGQYAAFVYLRNNTSFQLDMSLNKDIRINERMRVTLRAVALNFLNHPFFALGNTDPNSNSFGQVTSASGNRTVQLRASFEW